MGYQKWADIAGDVTPEARARIDALKEEARADQIAFSLSEVRKARQVTQSELARRLECSQPTVSGFETAADNKISTVRDVVESLGGRLEIVAVFDDERIAIA